MARRYTIALVGCYLSYKHRSQSSSTATLSSSQFCRPDGRPSIFAALTHSPSQTRLIPTLNFFPSLLRQKERELLGNFKPKHPTPYHQVNKTPKHCKRQIYFNFVNTTFPTAYTYCFYNIAYCVVCVCVCIRSRVQKFPA